MSNEQYAFLRKDKVPSLAQWQQAIDSAGFDLKIDPGLKIFEHSGFLPCKLLGHDSGVETYYYSANEVIENCPDIEDEIGDRDYCVSFRWGGNFSEAACAMILSYALMSNCDAVVSYEGEEPSDPEAFRSETEEMINEAKKAFRRNK